MAKTTVKEEIAVPAADLWALVADFGNVPWIPGGDQATVEGAGVGMTRSLMDGAVVERLESIDESKQQIGYTIEKGLPLPITDYHATMTVSARGEDRSELDWTCTYEPAGVSAEDADAQVRGLYGTMIGWIKENLGAA